MKVQDHSWSPESEESYPGRGYLATGEFRMTNPWLPYQLPSLKAYILAPGMVQIEDVVYNLPERTEERGRSLPKNPEFIVPVKENSADAARAAMEGLYRIVFD
jgi:hypothetical protein